MSQIETTRPEIPTPRPARPPPRTARRACLPLVAALVASLAMTSGCAELLLLAEILGAIQSIMGGVQSFTAPKKSEARPEPPSAEAPRVDGGVPVPPPGPVTVPPAEGAGEMASKDYVNERIAEVLASLKNPPLATTLSPQLGAALLRVQQMRERERRLSPNLQTQSLRAPGSGAGGR